MYKLYSSLTDLEQCKTRAEIDLDALRSNYRLLKDTFCPPDSSTRMIAVVKAEAYGHGAPECVRTLLSEGCDFFAVSCIDEAVAVRMVCDRERKSADILILGYTPTKLATHLARYNIIQALLSEDYAVKLDAAAQEANVLVRAHAAIDTGMNRIGFVAHSDDEIAAAVTAISRVHRLSHLRLEGMFTHFSRADEAPGGEGETRTEQQAARYRAVRRGLEERGVQIPFHHVCNSAAAVRRASDRLDGVRVGILLFGARPSDYIELPLKPVMKLKTVISHLHKLLPGEAVSYGGDYTAESERLIATIPIGYADGFLRAYSGAFVTVHTALGAKTAPIVGRICMDQCMIDVTNTGAQTGDTVTLFGGDPKELYAYADRASTVDYESLCLISSRVTRRYVGDVTSDENEELQRTEE
ncbi:MAG: alanine racemase [Clostridia bacterium]|nr:alanine racemase [Clostridia bacterium]